MIENCFSVCMFFPQNEKEQNQWDYILSHWEPSQIYLIGAEGHDLRSVFKNAIKISGLRSLPSIPLAMTAPKLGRFIKGEESIYDFNHPQECIYFFGPNNKNLTLEDDEIEGVIPNHLIYVPVDTNDEMYNWTAGAIVLYDRYLKKSKYG
jgi:hypothetical protein